MLTIRKKLEEQAASSGKGNPDSTTRPRERQVTRKLSFRSRLLTAEANELGGVLPSEFFYSALL